MYTIIRHAYGTPKILYGDVPIKCFHGKRRVLENFIWVELSMLSRHVVIFSGVHGDRRMDRNPESFPVDFYHGRWEGEEARREAWPGWRRPGRGLGPASRRVSTVQSAAATRACSLLLLLVFTTTPNTSKQNIDTNNNRVQTGSSDIGSDVKSRLRRWHGGSCRQIGSVEGRSSATETVDWESGLVTSHDRPRHLDPSCGWRVSVL